MSLCRMWAEGMPPEVLERARNELGETPQVKESALNLLLDLINDDSTFDPVTDESYLLRFLRARKHSAERAYKTLRNHYAFRARYSGFMTDISPRDCRRILLQDHFCLSPNMDSTGAAVLYVAAGSIDLKTSSVEEMYASILTTLDLALDCEALQVSGISLIGDYSGISARLFAQYCKPSLLMMFAQILRDAWPFRIKAIHYVNEPSYLNFAYNTLMRPLLSKKL